MKNLKLPKKIEIGADTFHLKYNVKKAGASFDFAENEIEVGTMQLKNSPGTIFASILHEVSEICHCICNTRYSDYGTMADFKFFMTHKEFQTHNELLAQAIKQFIK